MTVLSNKSLLVNYIKTHPFINGRVINDEKVVKTVEGDIVKTKDGNIKTVYMPRYTMAYAFKEAIESNESWQN